MSGRVRAYLTPGWLVFHVITIALVVAMVLLGHWQLDVSDAKHFNLQNFAYALQWWVFSAFALVMWARIVRDRGRGEGARSQSAEPVPEPHMSVPYRRYVMPTSAERPPTDDPVLRAYNDYLAGLAERGEGTGR